MKVIDLLNKIANGEELPSKIMYQDKIYYMVGNNDYENYEYEETPTLLFAVGSTSYINEEIEIIEDKPFSERVEEIYNRHIDYIYNKEDKKIEKLERFIPQRESDTYCTKYNEVADKINEIIDKLNKEE